MMLPGDLDYACARIAARFGERPDELAWRTLEAIRGLPALLEAARSLPFRRWIAGLAEGPDAHAIEEALIARRRALVAEVVRWMPDVWKASVEWAGLLADLPVLEHLARGGEALPWMRRDALYGPVCTGAAPPSAGLLVPLVPGWQRPDGLFGAWRKEWTQRLPTGALARGTLLDELSRTLASRPMAAVVLAGPPPGAESARSALAARLTLLFRRANADPAAAFVFLALSALDLERLRGELLRRALFSAFRLAA